MKLLLVAVNAKYIHSNLAVYSLFSSAKAYQESIEIAEYTINQKWEYILQEIYKKKPDVLCFSCYIWNYDYVRQIAREFSKLRPDVPIWVGGPETSYETQEMFAKNPFFYGAMIGEGEQTFLELVSYYCEGKPESLSQIAGIAFRQKDDGTVYRTRLREPLDLSLVPFAYETMEDFAHRIVYYESSRGCPFSCSYCLSSLEKKLRLRDLGLVKKELSFFIERKVPQVKFVDRTFNCVHEHAMEIWRFIQEADRGITNFHFEIAADLLTEEEIALLSTFRPGLVQLEIGVQSTNPRTLQEIHRTMSLPRLEFAVRQIRQAANIHLHLDLIAGLPYESYARFQESFREIYAWKPHQLQLGFLKVLKGSFLYERRGEYGIVCSDRPPYEVMRTAWISYDEILALKLVEEMLERYYNSGQYEVTMKLLDVAYPDSFGFFLALGQFYERNKLFGKKYSRLQRSQILLDFLADDRRISVEMVEESLLYDLYYRENIKSRPRWAKNPAGFSNMTKRFCKKGSLSHVEPFFYRFPARETAAVTKLPERLGREVYILFDYEARDVLTHQAKVTEIAEGDYES